MTEEEKSKLQQIKQLSDSILAIATENKKLEDIDSLEQNRKCLIEIFFSNPVNEDDAKEVAQVIENVLQTNEKITQMLEQNKQQLSKEFNQFKKSQKATNAYLSNL